MAALKNKMIINSKHSWIVATATNRVVLVNGYLHCIAWKPLIDRYFGFIGY